MGLGIEPRESDHVFACYTSLLQIKKQSETEEDEKMMKCEVLKCGFSMVFELEGTNDHDNVSWEVSSDEPLMVDNSDESPMVDDHIIQESDVISIDGQGSDYDEGQQEEQTSCMAMPILDQAMTQCKTLVMKHLQTLQLQQRFNINVTLVLL
ncbi:unnamed protein product [Thlaspi arvense]|uniref:Uncharacterized protein n=1 Tax=Thlaspi arvense TaxID=13288 RepID=A0AAU9SQS5_THLAR|nr:unnamed protein product [Thlaspi arvense]